MRKAFIVSGAMLAVLLALVLSGVLDFGDGVRKYILEGNGHYDAGEYDKALEAYNTGLDIEPENKKLGYNSGQVSYILKDYQQAANCFINATDNENRYLNWGNSFLRLGDETTDGTGKFMCYNQALEVYKQGIIAYPENMALKYNYEYVLEKISAMNNNSENQQNQGDEDQQNQDGENQQNQDGENQQNQDGENQQGQEEENQDQNSGENQQNSGQDDSSNSNEQENTQQGENPDDSDQQDENAGGGEQQDESGDDEDRQGENQQTQGNQTSQEQQDTLTGNELEQVLEILERQEKDSLKNNREIRIHGKEDKYDW